jgi:hypothetical protein
MPEVTEVSCKPYTFGIVNDVSGVPLMVVAGVLGKEPLVTITEAPPINIPLISKSPELFINVNVPTHEVVVLVVVVVGGGVVVLVVVLVVGAVVVVLVVLVVGISVVVVVVLEVVVVLGAVVELVVVEVVVPAVVVVVVVVVVIPDGHKSKSP